MFYSFSQFFANQRPSALYQEFLQREGVDLEQILEHEDTVTELKKGNRELLDCLQAQVPELLQWISRAEGCRQAPFVAAEILTSDAFMNEVTSDCLAFPLFFRFLQAPAPLNDTLAGYNVRACLKLLERQEARVADFLITSTQWTDLLLGHLQSRAVAELVFELLCSSRLTEERQALLKGVVGKLAATGERQVAVNAGWIGGEVLRRADNVGEWKRLVGVLLSEDVLQTLGSVITTETAGDQAALVLCTLISHYSFPQLLAPLLLSPPQANSLQALTALLHTAALHLQTPITTSPTPTSYGDIAPPLGPARLQLLHLLLSCLKALGPVLSPLLQDCSFLQTCTKLFLAYPWHSSLHIAYCSLVTTVLEGQSQSLKVTLMEEVRLVELLACLGCGGGQRKGCMGQVTQMGNALLTVSRRNSYFQQFLSEAVWTDFCQNYLFPQTKVESTQYLSTPRTPSEDELESFPSTGLQIPNEAITLEELDQQNPFDLWGDEDSGPEDLRDLYSAVNYWKVPVRSGDLEDLE